MHHEHVGDTPVEVTADFLHRVDSITSLIAYRYPASLPPDVLLDLKKISGEARTLVRK